MRTPLPHRGRGVFNPEWLPCCETGHIPLRRGLSSERSHRWPSRVSFVTTSLPAQRSDSRPIAEDATFSIILALSFSHFLNDTMQSLVPALYPMLKDSYGLSFAQIGLITLTMQVTSSFLQPM